MIIGVPLIAVIYDIVKKLVYRGLRKHGQLERFEKPDTDEELSDGTEDQEEEEGNP